MANVEQFEKAVTEAGAVAVRIMRGSRGAERLVIQTPGGLITRRSRYAAISAKTFRPQQLRPRKSSTAPNALQPHRPQA